MLYYKIAIILKSINLYINILKLIFERLKANLNIRGYKLLYKNLRYYNLYIYNYSTLDKVAII